MVSHLIKDKKITDELGVLGDYRLIKQIGQGSLGSLFVGEHRFTKQQYALKILPEELTQDRGFIARFEEEIGQVASLNHPNIAKIFNVSFSQGVYFLVTEFIADKYGESTQDNAFFPSFF